ncbi:hypothetical protein SODALDRAFT_54431 [Sodiomyces alkalinus F11]|uniref:Homeobox domain-containing protein n=1 Tax=Sodiomyces alkalinus (strain CBS 110278 / VKM F-3762 / F11) TaxID=1314773 RepID=A0A3N2PNB7_SODAK|nr:hypothetical protein SODALDRAFT_54431 [Sodiomyces alkalinus F11]ROT35924.1 hypothetical protein SODALDRAFT_54431 [Sodiomyces alkalinus F11]
MGYSPPWSAHNTNTSRNTSGAQHKMSMLAMTGPSPHSGFTREFLWDGGRSTEHGPQPRAEPERVALPSIRQAFPEIHLRVHSQEPVSSRPMTATAAAAMAGMPGAMTSPEYIYSPNSNKRRRISLEDEQERERASRIPRLYETPGGLSQKRQPTSPPAPRSAPAPDAWTAPARTSPYVAHAPIPAMRSPVPREVQDRPHADPRPTTLPSLPSLPQFEREPIHPPNTNTLGTATEDFQPIRSAPTVAGGPPAEPGPSYRPSSYAYPYQHPNHGQSNSVGAIQQPFERSPFSAGSYGQPYQEFMRVGDMGTMGAHSDSKQRKRRGNLPKETTDKLRAWFIAHLQHPYPTEDEKQELMRQTGLQMNQISNWFINARRRQLPTMINNARAESDARSVSGRGGAAGTAPAGRDTKILPSTERGDFGSDDGKRSSAPLSDGEPGRYDEELDGPGAAHANRGTV